MNRIDTDLLLPPSSGRIFCIGLNYRDHAAEGRQEIPEHPVFFIRFPTSFVGDGEDLWLPQSSSKYDFEGELVVVLGKPGRHIKHEDALSHVAGYSIAMDGSVRDYQKRTSQWTMGKNFDRSGAISNHMMPASRLPASAHGLRLETRLNGVTVQQDNTANMIFTVPHVIATLSEAMQLQAGDRILTGTPAGVGFARDPKLWLKAGDLVEVEIEGIGVLKNRVINEPSSATS